MVYVDVSRRKRDHTTRALDFALSLPVTPLLLVIYYPAWGYIAPSFYTITRGIAVPLSRKESESFKHIGKLIYLPDNTIEVVC